MMDEPTFVLPFHGVEDFPPESAPLAVKSAQATSNGLIDPVMFGGRTSQGIPGPRGMTRRVTLQERFIFLVTPLNRLMDFVVDTASLSMRLA